MILGTALYKYAKWKKILAITAFLITIITLSVISFLALSPAKAAPGDTDSFITTWKTDNPGSSNNSSITIGTADGGYLYNVDWDNDGQFDEFGLTGNASHDFGTPGTYTVRIQGDFPRIYASNGDALKLVDVEQWGTIQWASMNAAFFGASNMNISATDAPDLTIVTNMTAMFNGASMMNHNLSNWDVSQVTTMSYMFANATQFNGAISTWNVSNVTNMENMFLNAETFNSDIGSWDTSKVIGMSTMFSGAKSFNQYIGDWDVSKVIYLAGMFNGAVAFNQDISNWNTASLVNASEMFYQATAFNYPVDSFNMSNVTGAFNMLASSGLSTNNADKTLKAWVTQPLQQGITLGAINYCTSGDAINYLVNSLSWAVQASRTCGSLFAGGGSVSVADNTPANTDLGAFTVTNFTLRSNSPFMIACTQPGADDDLFTVGGQNGDHIYNTTILTHGNPLDANADSNYAFCIRSFDASGDGFDQNFTVQVLPSKQIAAVNFSESGGKKLLSITGFAFFPTPGDKAVEAIESSRVRLNGQDLKFCPDGFGMTAQQMIDTYSSFYPTISQTITDNPTCYLLIVNGGSGLTDTQATIWLSDDFDITKQGTVSVNGSPVYTFNPGAGGDVTPTVDVNGNKDIDNNPIIPSLPTFTGVAEPGATVVVTVHSDPVTCTTTADQDGRWSCTLSSALPAGVHTVFVQVTNPDSSVVELGPYSVVVAGTGGGAVSNNTPLAPNTGFLAKHAEILREVQHKKTLALSVFIVGGAVAGLLVGAGSTLAYRRLKK